MNIAAIVTLIKAGLSYGLSTNRKKAASQSHMTTHCHALGNHIFIAEPFSMVKE